jgi:prevent-host-death family protein
MATAVGIRDLKNSLSRYLRLVRDGERVIVLDRGRPVAILSAAPSGGPALTTADHLASLAARGLLTLGRGALGRRRRRRRRPSARPRVNLSDAIREDREERP